MHARSLVLLLSLTAPCAWAQGGYGRVTAEDRKKPPLIHWQRSLRDALALSKQKGLPLLVVANQDGEIACDVLAGSRYKEAAFAALANRYVAVIGSVDRHNPRDYDAEGRRIPCPRFGCITCGEHIAIEPQLFAAYFQGQRTAPRHIGIGEDGKRLFDRYLDRDLRAIDRALGEHVDSDAAMPRLRAGSEELAALLKSPAARDRDAVEARFAAADPAGRREILRAAALSGQPHPDLYRLALRRGPDQVRRLAAQQLAKSPAAANLELVLDAIHRTREPQAYQHLLRALAGIAKTGSSAAQRAHNIHRALGAAHPVLDALLERVPQSVESGIPGPEELAQLDKQLDELGKRARQGDPGGKLGQAIARATLRYARQRRQSGRDPSFLLQDCLQAVRRARAAGNTSAGLDLIRCEAEYLLGQTEAAAATARRLLDPGTDTTAPILALASEPGIPNLLRAYIAAGMQALGKPIRDESRYPRDTVTGIDRAYRLLCRWPGSPASDWGARIEFLYFLAAYREAGAVLRAALRQHPADQDLHRRFRAYELWLRGPEGLLRAYEGSEFPSGLRALIDWHRGEAALEAAGAWQKSGDQQALRAALEAADRAYQSSLKRNPDYRDHAGHGICRAQAGLAALQLQAGDLAAAVTAALAGAEARPASFSFQEADGSSLERTCRRLRRRLRGDAHAALRQRLDTGLRDLGLGGR